MSSVERREMFEIWSERNLSQGNFVLKFLGYLIFVVCNGIFGHSRMSNNSVKL